MIHEIKPRILHGFHIYYYEPQRANVDWRKVALLFGALVAGGCIWWWAIIPAFLAVIR